VAAETDDCALMLEAVARGAGVAFLPASFARDAIRLGRVRSLTSFDSAVTLRALVRDREQLDLAERAIERLQAQAASLYADPTAS
jgi:DNA-binding transcriptional LysR family regulator